MKTSRRGGEVLARAATAVLTMVGMVAVVIVGVPLSFEAPFVGMHVTGLESPWIVGGSYVAVLMLAAFCVRGMVRAAIVRWPDREASVRIGVLAVPPQRSAACSCRRP